MENGVFVEWDNRYSVGIPLIDEQHKKLIEMTNTLYEACLGGTETATAHFREVVRGTVDYVKYHFTAEEKLLENAKYPDLACHKKEHESFILKIFEEVKKFEEGKKFVPNVFVRYLKDWILAHIAVEDKKYAGHILNPKNRALWNKIGG
ncbi:MAG: bacteriohemerythrin [Spirochaetaceae bacterium]|jgi:hemerythrin|nr:bacteriohemerythrin [Spirochaetaceae bacterium]